MNDNILIVDDDKLMMSVVKQYTNSAKFGAFEAYDGEHALEVLANVHTDTHLILTDFNMPNMNGLELATAIKANKDYKHIPIILMTNDMDILHKFSVESRFRVFEDMLTKPFMLDEMLAKVNRLLPLK